MHNRHHRALLGAIALSTVSFTTLATGATRLSPVALERDAGPVARTSVPLDAADRQVPPKARRAGTLNTTNLLGAPANDNCANAIVVTDADCPFQHTVDTSGAAMEADEPGSSGTSAAAGVWYSYTTSSPFGATVGVETCNGSNFDTVLEVFRVDGAAYDFANFVNVASNDDTCGLRSQVSFQADPGVEYKIRASGFDGETGILVLEITSTLLACDPIAIAGALGSGSPDWPSTTQTQSVRLFRDAIPSTCAGKACPGTFSAGTFTTDAYTFSNDSGAPACVTVNFDPNTGAGPCGTAVHAIAYLGTYDPTNICLNYIGDVGSSVTQPFSFTVPAGQAFIIVIGANSSGGGIGCTYAFSVVGDICGEGGPAFDFCLANDGLGVQDYFRLVTTLGDPDFGEYQYVVGATGEVFCGHAEYVSNIPGRSLTAYDRDSPNYLLNVSVNHATKVGSVSLLRRCTGVRYRVSDRNYTNSDCALGTPLACSPPCP